MDRAGSERHKARYFKALRARRLRPDRTGARPALRARCAFERWAVSCRRFSAWCFFSRAPWLPRFSQFAPWPITPPSAGPTPKPPPPTPPSGAPKRATRRPSASRSL